MPGKRNGPLSEEELYRRIVALVAENQSLSISSIQRELQIGLGDVVRLLTCMTREKIVGPVSRDGGHPVHNTDAAINKLFEESLRLHHLKPAVISPASDHNEISNALDRYNPPASRAAKSLIGMMRNKSYYEEDREVDDLVSKISSYIKFNNTHDADQLSFRDKLDRVIACAASSGADEAKALANSLFETELSQRPQTGRAEVNLPTSPPVLWKDRDTLDATPPTGKRWSPPDFIRHVYAPWLGKGLTRAHIRNDHALSVALDRWLAKNPMPDDLDLPIHREITDRKLAEVEDMRMAGVEPKFSIREAANMERAAQRRKGKE